MKQFFKRNLYKVALVVTLMAIATVAVTAGTFAALSATYTWNSDQTKAGEFNYSDSTFNFTLFDKETVFPGNSGSGVIETPDFGTNSVVWTFAETNESTMPIIYYFLDGSGNPINIYSKYDFATVCADKYVKLSDKYVASANILNTASTMVTGLATSKTIYWAWPSAIYSDNAGTVATVADYDAYNTALCTGDYKFNSDMITFLNGTIEGNFNNCDSYATAVTDGSYTFVSKTPENPFSIKKDKLYVSGGYAPILSDGAFKTVADDTAIKANDAFVFFVTKKALENGIETVIESAGLDVQIDKTKTYKKSGDVVSLNDSGSLYLAKLYPVAASARPTVSVQITATVTQG